MGLNRYERKIKKERQEKREKRKKYRWFFRAVHIICLIGFVLVSGMFLSSTAKLIVKSPGTIMGYLLYVIGTIGGLCGIFEIRKLAGQPLKEVMLVGVLVLFGIISVGKFVVLTYELPKLIFFNSYQTKVLHVDDVIHKKGSIDIKSGEETYALEFYFGDVPDSEYVKIEYLPVSKVILDIEKASAPD